MHLAYSDLFSTQNDVLVYAHSVAINQSQRDRSWCCLWDIPLGHQGQLILRSETTSSLVLQAKISTGMNPCVLIGY